MEICTKFETQELKSIPDQPTIRIDGLEIDIEIIHWFFYYKCVELFITTDEGQYDDAHHDEYIERIKSLRVDEYKGLIYIDSFDDKRKGVLLVPRPCCQDSELD